MVHSDPDGLDARDQLLIEMLFREFVRSEVGAAVAESLLQSAAEEIARGLGGVTVEDEYGFGLCTVDADDFTFRLRGWPLRSVPIDQARTIIEQELRRTIGH